LNQSFQILLTDLLSLTTNITWANVKPFALAALLFGLMTIPLKNVDRRDMISGATFMSFMVASGVLLLIVIPDITLAPIATGYQALIVAIVSIASLARWNWNTEEVVVVQKSAPEKLGTEEKAKKKKKKTK